MNYLKASVYCRLDGELEKKQSLEVMGCLEISLPMKLKEKGGSDCQETLLGETIKGLRSPLGSL